MTAGRSWRSIIVSTRRSAITLNACRRRSPRFPPAVATFVRQASVGGSERGHRTRVDDALDAGFQRLLHHDARAVDVGAVDLARIARPQPVIGRDMDQMADAAQRARNRNRTGCGCRRSATSSAGRGWRDWRSAARRRARASRARATGGRRQSRRTRRPRDENDAFRRIFKSLQQDVRSLPERVGSVRRPACEQAVQRGDECDRLVDHHVMLGVGISRRGEPGGISECV